MSKYAIMPLSDYVEACDTIREYTGNTLKINSREIPSEIRAVYAQGKIAGYENGFTDGKCTLSGTYVFKKSITENDLPDVAVTESLSGKNVEATFIKITNVSEGTGKISILEVNKIAVGSKSTPNLVIESKSYGAFDGMDIYFPTSKIVYDFDKGYWKFGTDTSEIAFEYRNITFNEPVIVSEEFYKAFVQVLEPVLDVYEQGKDDVYSEIEPLNAELEQTLYSTTEGNSLETNIGQAGDDFQAIKNKLIESGVEVADGTRTAEYADKVDEVYEAGKKSQYDEFWDLLQNYGNRTNYTNAFKEAGFEYFHPKYKVSHTSAEGGLSNVFMYCRKLKKLESGYIDFSNAPRGNATGNSMYYTFASCSILEEIEDIGLSPMFCYGVTFAYCPALRTIAKITVDEDTLFSSAFHTCKNLENLTIEGTIGQNGFDVQWSTKLTHESLMSIINALKDYSGTSTWKTVTLGSENLAKLTQEELLIMEQKQWNYG